MNATIKRHVMKMRFVTTLRVLMCVLVITVTPEMDLSAQVSNSTASWFSK